MENTSITLFDEKGQRHIFSAVGKVIFVPAGQWIMLSTFQVPPGCRIEGAGKTYIDRSKPVKIKPPIAD